MAARTQAGARVLLGTWVLLLVHCKGSKPEQPSPVDAGIEASAGPTEPLDPGIGRLPPRVAGTMDVHNRYPSTVMLLADAEAQEALCSGILLHSRLVLTAASCLCLRPGSSAVMCPPRTSIRTVHYGAVGNWNFKEETTERRFRTYTGSVRAHPEFTAQIDSQGTLVSSQADLAVIHLDVPVEERMVEVPWAQTAAQVNERLVMAGFGQEVEGGGFPGIRYFRQNKVTQVLEKPRGQFFYEQQGAFLYEGFPGGPCLREEGQERWLVGIASPASKGGLFCTGLLPFQDWLQGEMQRVAKAAPASAPPTPKKE
jgi:hypothetical protein